MASTWQPRPSQDGRSRVRFSEDIARAHVETRGRETAADTLDLQEHLSGSRDLDVGTGRVEKTAAGRASARSPESSRSPSPTGGTSKAEPHSSSRGRNRGMSLRSSLFTKNMSQRAQDTDDSIIEMGPYVAPAAEEKETRSVSCANQRLRDLPDPSEGPRPAKRPMCTHSSVVCEGLTYVMVTCF